MINEKIKILSIQLIVGLWLLALSPSLGQAADVTLTVGDGSGVPGSTDNVVEISLDNPNDRIKGMQMDICDEDNYLSCTACETAERTSGLSCTAEENESGCCRVMFFDFMGGSIAEGDGPIFTLNYSVSVGAPAGECRDLTPEEVSISDESGDPLPSSDITLVAGEFCFNSGTTSTTTSLTTTTTTISHSYKVSISPLSATIKSGASLQFSAKTTYAGEEVEGTYSWEITSAGSIESSIDVNGLFTAGDNDTTSDVEETIEVTDTAHENKYATATITIKVKEDPHTECEVAISPLAATVLPGEMLTLVASNTGDCKTPQYEWSLHSDTDSSIESQDATSVYTAGANDGTEPLTDVITVTDTVNEVDAEAEITIRAEGGSIRVLDDPLWKSHWIPLLYLMVIEGEGTHFGIFNSTLAFEPSEAAVSLLSLVLSDLYIWDIILVMPSWLAGEEDQTVTVTVTTGDEVVSDDFTISLLPLMLDQRI